MSWLEWLSNQSNTDRSSLFKYASLEIGKCIVQNCQLRFTQLNALNDTFEINAFPSSTVVSDRRFYEESAKIGSFSMLTPQQIYERDRQRREDELERNQYINEVLPKLGVLSLTERRNNQLMWSHYAEGHKGMLIEFNAGNGLFSEEYFPSDWPCQHTSLFKLRKIKYRKSAPVMYPDLRKGLEQVVFTKSNDWDYEHEWRLCRPLEDADVIQSKNLPFPIHLFNFPSAAIRSVYFGSRVERSQIVEIIRSIRSDARTQHITFYSAHLKSDEYSIRFISEDR